MAEIVLRGRRYPALFDLQNVKELQEHFGDLKVVAEKLNDPRKPPTSSGCWCARAWSWITRNTTWTMKRPVWPWSKS